MALETAAPGAGAASGLCDSHAHLGYVLERRGADFLERLESAYGGGEAIILDPGVDFDDFPARREAFGALPFVRLAAGIWPDSASMKALRERVPALEVFIRDPACAAVGECGLDYHWMNGTEAEQEALFRAQAELAVLYGKPIIVHSREAFEPTLTVLRDYAESVPVIIHCFGYGAKEAEAFLGIGCYLSFAGNLTYKRSSELRAACAIVPDSRFLLETDSPYMCPEPRRGKDSSPLDIYRTYELASDIRGSSVGELARIVAGNARALFDHARA